MRTLDVTAQPSGTISAGAEKVGRFFRRTGLGAAIVVAAFSSAASAQQQIINYGQLAITGYSGSQAAQPPDGADPFDYLGINLNGPSARVVDVRVLGPQGQLSNAPKPFTVTASQVGQVFGVTMDNAPRPNLYVAATSNYGLAISVADPSGQPRRVRKGEPGAQWMAGQFGPPALGGGPGSIWRIDGTTGAVALFANIASAANGAASLGALAFDPRTNQIFAVDRGTGIVHRFRLDGVQRGTYDHGTEGRGPVGLPPIPAPPPAPVNLAGPAFDTENPATWGFAQPARRVYALAVRGDRLYYSVAQGPQVWSVGISPSGAVAAGPRVEVEVPSLQDGVEISSIAFDGQGRMYLATRGPTTGDYFRYDLASGGASPVLRYVRKLPGDPAPGLWRLTPEIYSVGLLSPYANADGGVALHYGYNPDNVINFNSCEATVWSTGENLLNPGDPSLEPGSFLNVDGLQGNAQNLVQPQNSPPLQSWFVDYDDQNGDPNFHGHMGAVATLPCPGQPAPPVVPPPPPPPPPPPVSCPPGTYFSNGQCVIIPTCPPGTYFQNGQCVYVDCPPGFYNDNGQCVPPPVSCPPGTFYYQGQCYPISCPPGLIELPNGQCTCPPGEVYFNGHCVPPQGCPPWMIELPGGVCWCPLGTIFDDGFCNPTDCPPGQVMKNGFCQPCPPDQVVINGQCKPCPPGHDVENGQCEPICPPHLVFDNGVCKPCPVGQVAVNGICVDQPCPAGQELWNGMCVPACPPGEHHQPPAGACEPPDEGIPPCPAGQEMWEGQCVPVCPLGQQHQPPDGHCEELDLAPLPCPAGQEMWQGQCVPVCPPGEFHQEPDGACEPPDEAQPCAPDEEMVDGACVPKCGLNQFRAEDGTCKGFELCLPPNEIWQGKCVPECADGQVHIQPDGACIAPPDLPDFPLIPTPLPLPQPLPVPPIGPQPPPGPLPPGPGPMPIDPQIQVPGVLEPLIPPQPPEETQPPPAEPPTQPPSTPPSVRPGLQIPGTLLPGIVTPPRTPPEPPSTTTPEEPPAQPPPSVRPGLQIPGTLLPGIVKPPATQTPPSTPPPSTPPTTTAPPQRTTPPVLQVNPNILKNLPGLLKPKTDTPPKEQPPSETKPQTTAPQTTAPQRTTPQTTAPQTTTPATPQLKILPQLFGIQPQQQQQVK